MTAPAPATYEQALAAAEAIVAAHAATNADPVQVVSTTADQLGSVRDRSAAWAKAAIQHLWLAVNPYNDKAVQAFAEQAAGLMESAQTAVARVSAAGQSQQLAAAGIAVQSAPSNPLNVRAPAAVVRKGQLVLHQATSTVDYAGPGADVHVSKADMTTAGVFTRPAEVFRYATSQGDIDAAAQASQRIDSLIDDNLMLSQRLAQQQVLVAAVTDLDTGKTRSGPKVIGYRRVIHPERSRGGTCGMCIAAADRIYHVGQLMPLHHLCHCTIAAVTEDFDPADDLNAVDLNQLYKEAGGTSVAHLKRTRYQVDEHGELGPTLVPKSKYRPQTTGSKRRAGGTSLLEDQPPQAVVAKQQLSVLEANLAKMRADGVGEDSSKIAYHLKLIAKLRKQLADDTQ